MRSSVSFLLLTLFLGSAFTSAQEVAGSGTIVLKGLAVKGKDRSKKPLARKRFYIFPGGLAENQALIDRIKAAQVTPRDCFYVALKASPCYLAWLREENCETPFCRVIKQDDITAVPEFQAAYNKGLPLYGRKPDIAMSWILNNMSDDLVSGYYRHQKGVIEKILSGTKPLQSSMTTSTGADATFVDLPAADRPTKYLVSNLLPVEIDDKSYVWACEVDVQRNRPAALPLTLDPKRKNCSLVIKELRSCTAESCEKK